MTASAHGRGRIAAALAAVLAASAVIPLAGTAFQVVDQATNTVTVALPEAEFGTPGPGWAFSVVLTGQDGFAPGQARQFTATPGQFTFGVCASGNPSPICRVSPDSVPRAMDVMTPPGVDQDTELNPTLGPVVIQPVVVP